MCLWETDKQLVALIHVRALDVLSAHQQSSLRYQSVTLFLRGRSTSEKFTVYCIAQAPLFKMQPFMAT